MAETIRYKDIDLAFTAHPVTGDIAVKTNESAIKAAMKHLILMNFYESPFHPEVGSGVLGMLFEPTNFVTALGIRKHIELVLENFEPRIEVMDLHTVPNLDAQAYDVTIKFRLLNQNNVLELDLILEQIR